MFVFYQDFKPTSVFSTTRSLHFGISFKILSVFFLLSQNKPAHKPAHTAGHDAAKEKMKPKPEEKKTSPARCDGSATENGVEDGEREQLDGEECRALIRPESAFSSDSKTCNTNPHLNALNVDGGCHRDEGLEAVICEKEV